MLQDSEGQNQKSGNGFCRKKLGDPEKGKRMRRRRKAIWHLSASFSKMQIETNGT